MEEEKKNQLFVKVLIGLLQFVDEAGRKFLNQGGDIGYVWSLFFVFCFLNLYLGVFINCF